MGESNGAWGTLATDEQREAWDSYARIPEPGANTPLDSFVERKRISHDSLVRLGARLSAPTVLCFPFEGGMKYRNVVLDTRWAWHDSTFNALKIVPGTDRERAIICEGETDACRLTMLYECDVAVMPVGATAWKPQYTSQVAGYAQLFVGLDNDRAGEKGYEKIKEALRHAQRHSPPEGCNDWCDLDGDAPQLPAPTAGPSSILVPAKELLTLEVPELISWFDGAILPVGGTMIMHGTYKSYKTWMALSMAASLAQMEPWCSFEPTEEPARVAYINFEVPWAYYKARVAKYAAAASRPDLFGKNFLSYSPTARPRLVAGNDESEDAVIHDLLEGEVQVVFIDPVRRAMGYADMNAENEVRRMLHFAQRLTDHGITVVMLHHDNKDADRKGGGDPSGMTGSGAWAGDADSIVSISAPAGATRDSDKRNLHFLLRNAPSPGPRGFRLREDGGVEWHFDPWVEGDDEPEAVQF